MIFKDYGEWIFRGTLMAAVLAQLWLTSTFVTRAEFVVKTKEIVDTVSSDRKTNQDAHLVIQTSIADIATTMKLMVANQTRIEDHESRMRLLESRQIDGLTRDRKSVV